MNIKKIALTIVIFIASVLCGNFLFASIVSWRDNHFACDTKLVIKKADTSLSLVITYFFTGNKGMSVMKGRLEQGAQRYSVSRKNYFSINKFRPQIAKVTSTLAVRSVADNAPTEALSQLLPPFYLSESRTMEFYIFQQGWDGYIFSTRYVPSFYCRRL